MPPTQSATVLAGGVTSTNDLARYLSALTADIMTGSVKAKAANKATAAAEKLLQAIDQAGGRSDSPEVQTAHADFLIAAKVAAGLMSEK